MSLWQKTMTFSISNKTIIWKWKIERRRQAASIGHTMRLMKAIRTELLKVR
jgi:hypothetical protein